ncbi:family 20 glycosylhydrolase [Humibacter albus]|uniref:family 20 glycosylhydrolase n=1 Tax=Humibacter albus TaxID=427754 RepID=UPI0003B4CE11|nr:family 20 glycosylhydrolase [Humibacter albus]
MRTPTITPLAVRRAVAALGVTAVTAALLAVGLVQASAARAADVDAGTDVALASAGATVTASGQEVAGKWGPDQAIDGDTTTRWSSNAADDANITVELAQPTTIDHVVIYWEDACAAKYKLQVSNDGTTFTDATDTIAPTCATKDTETLTKVDASTPYRYVRMQGIDRTPIGGQKYGMSLYEFQVWDGPEPVASTSTADGLTPKPQNLTVHGDAAPFELTSTARIVAPAALQQSATFLATTLRASTGFDLPVVTVGAADGDIVFTAGDIDGFSDQDEAYGLESDSARVTLTASTEHGAFDAVQTLLQLLPAFDESAIVVQTDWSVPSVSISDAPRFAYRGVMLDSARSFQTVDEVKSFLNEMAQFKLSVLHLHLADDQGWRIQITNDGKDAGDPIDYSLLTKVSGATGMTMDGYRNELGHTGFYTQAQYRDIVQYAADRQITVIPEIDAPSHTNAALHAIPQLNTANTQPGTDAGGTTPANGTGDVGYSTLDANSDVTWTFMTHVLTQLAAMTPGDYIDVGGDESAVTPAADYKTFITKSVQIVHDLGKQAIGWNEAAVGGVGTGDGIQYWTGGTSDTLNAIKNQGAKLIASRGSSAYLDMKYNGTTPIGLTWAGTGDFDKYYDWDPASVVQDNGVNLPDSDLLGVEGPMWSETIRGGSQAQFLAFPRAISLAEMGWTDQSKRSVSDFTARIAYVGQRLLAAGQNFYDGNKATWQWSMAGLPVAVSPGHDLTLSVGEVSAPGTKAAANGDGIAVDTTDDADGVSSSTLRGDLTATVDFGDGSAAVPASFRTDTARTSLTAGGLYTLRAEHTYASAGAYTGTVTASDGTTTTFTATVADGTPDPVEPSGWDSTQTPSLSVDATVDAGARLAGTLSGFEPGSYVTMTVGDTALGTVRPGSDGTLALSLPIDPGTYAGDYRVTATSGERTASDTVTVRSSIVPLSDPIDQSTMSVVSADSQETSGESAPATNAIDGDPSTYWHTQWSGASPAYPHWIVIDLGAEYDVSGLAYTQRPGQSNGRMKDYEIYVGDDPATGADDPIAKWGDPVATGAFLDVTREQVVEFDTAKTGRYIMLLGRDSINGNNFGGAAEIRVGGTLHTATPTVTLSATTVQAGDTLTVDAEHFAPSTELTVSLEQAAAYSTQGLRLLDDTATVLADQLGTDADGAAHADVTVPTATAAGAYDIVVSSSGADAATGSAPLTVTAADGGSTDPGDGGSTDPGDGTHPGDGTGTGGTGTGSGDTGAGDPGAVGTTGSDGTDASATGTDDAALASTGSDLGAPLALALLALLAGAGVVVLRLCRRARR